MTTQNWLDAIQTFTLVILTASSILGGLAFLRHVRNHR